MNFSLLESVRVSDPSYCCQAGERLALLFFAVLFADCLRIFPDLSAFCRVKSFIFFVLNGLFLTLDRHIVSCIPLVKKIR